MLHDARDRGDAAGALRAWRMLLTAEYSRVQALVRGFRHPSLPGQRIPSADCDDVAQNVFIRLNGKAGTLQGRSVGELRKFMSKATSYACLDYVDHHVRDDRRRGAAIDAEGDAGTRGVETAMRRLADQLAADADTSLEARAEVHEALAEVDDNKRAIIVLDLQGIETPEIAERLGLTAANVYQRRRRGLKQLKEALRERRDGT